MDLLTEGELPYGTSYPNAFLRAANRGIVHLEPWWVIDGQLLRSLATGLRQRFPARSLLPFAKREDNDDIACFCSESPGSVVVIHDFATPGREQRRVFSDFYAWLRAAVEDMIEFDQQEES